MIQSLQRAVSEVVSLFIDDPGFGLAVLSWTVAVALGHQHLPRPIAGPALVLGYAALLIAFARRRSHDA
ncbi:MAG: hypothetical protein ACLQVD_06150 [Capsulimonadaceae bacterium]